MANNIENKLSVYGPPDAVSAFIAAARGRHPKTGDTEGPNARTEPRPEQHFSFHALAPLPEEYGRISYGDRGASGRQRTGWDIEVETWGIKWGAYEHPAPECEPGLATYSFGTAWDGPHKVFMPKVARRFPALLFLLSFGGEGPTRGRALFTDRGKIGGAEEYRKEDYADVRPADEDDGKPGAWDAYEAAQNARLTSHLLWVGWVIAHRAGRTFAPKGCAPVLADWLEEFGLERLAKTIRETDGSADPSPVLLG